MTFGRPIPAVIQLTLRDPEDSGETFISLSTTLYQIGLIFLEPRELRRDHDAPEALLLTCTFVNAWAASSWITHPKIVEYWSASFANDLDSPPLTVPQRDVILDADDSRTCGCESRTSLLLRGRHLELTGALVCGDCFSGLPNYALPEDLPVERWASVYAYVWKIWLDCGLLENWALDELTSRDSELNREAVQLVRKAVEHFGAPVYFEIFAEDCSEPMSDCPWCEREGVSSPWRKPSLVCTDCATAFNFG